MHRVHYCYPILTDNGMARYISIKLPDIKINEDVFIGVKLFRADRRRKSILVGDR
jgi:predicted aspartyl protease